MKKTLLSIGIIAVLLITAGLGCKGLSEEEIQTVQPETLEYWTVFNDTTILNKFAEEYQKERPQVQINVRQVRYGEFDELFVNALADDVQPDIVSLHVRWLPRYLGRLSIMPPAVSVSRLVTKGKYAKETVVETLNNEMPNTDVVKSAFINTVGRDVVRDNEVYGLPLSVDSLAVYYNRDILDRSGVAIPPTTWSELLEVVKKVTKFDALGNIVQSGIAIGTGKNINNSPDIISALFLQNGIPVIKDGFVTFSSGVEQNIEGHPARETLRFYTDFARPTKEAYSWNESQGDALEAFANGRTAFYIGFAFDAGEIKARSPQINLGVIPLPQLNPGDPKNVANYWVESVVAKSTNQNTAWDFVRFISTPDKIAEYTKATGRLTPLRSQVAEQAEDKILGPFTITLLTAENWYRGFDFETAGQAMRNMIDQFLEPYGDVDPYQRDAAIINNAAAVVQQTL